MCAGHGLLTAEMRGSPHCKFTKLARASTFFFVFCVIFMIRSWAEFVAATDETLPMYGFCRYHWQERDRNKFIFVSFIGQRVPPLRKARIGHDKASVTSFFSVCARRVCVWLLMYSGL